MGIKIHGEGEAALQGIREQLGNKLKKGDALKVSMYSAEKVKRKEGEVWTDEDGKKWEMKNGIARSISHLEGAKRPWWCPECGKNMNGKANERMWNMKGKCLNCVVAEESKMRIEGKWEEYQVKALRANAIAKYETELDELRGWKEAIANPQNHFIDGRWEEWNIGIDEIKETIQEAIEIGEQRVAELKELQDGDLD